MDAGPDSAARLRAHVDPTVGTSAVVTLVFNTILDEIKLGVLQPGQHISDIRLAERFGVSRTPVREAIQRLREIGVIEAAANRFTRVAVIPPEETSESMTVWLALFTAVVDEVVADAHEDLAIELAAAREAFLTAVAAGDMVAVASANFQFFQRMADMSTNAHLRRAVRGVVHVVQLGSLHLPEPIDFEQLAEAQRLMIEAVRANDTAIGHEALGVLRALRIPLEDSSVG